MDELEKLKKKVKRLQNIIALNNKQIRALKPILQTFAKQIGFNSSDIKKIIQSLYENFNIEEDREKEPLEMNPDCRGTYI